MQRTTVTIEVAEMVRRSISTCRDHLSAHLPPAVPDHARQVGQLPLVSIGVEIEPEDAAGDDLALALWMNLEDLHRLHAASPDDELTYALGGWGAVPKHPGQSF